MKEDLLYFIWLNAPQFSKPLSTAAGEELIIIRKGRLNKDSGPDFTEARIKIDGIEHVGNVEFHLKSSDWLKHHHQLDQAYHNVILHVVFEDDMPIYDQFNLQIPTLILAPLISEKTLHHYLFLQRNASQIPCQKIFVRPDPIIEVSWLERLAIERLESKHKRLKLLWQHLDFHWQKALLAETIIAFGMKTNAAGFEQLAMKLPLEYLLKYGNDALKLHAICSAGSGFLWISQDSRTQAALATEYLMVQSKHGITRVEPKIWKLSKTRPANFPGNRVWHLSTFLFNFSQFFTQLLAAEKAQEIFGLVERQCTQDSPFSIDAWEFQNKQFKFLSSGGQLVQHLIINVISPFLFTHSKESGDQMKAQLALDLLMLLEPEDNRITRLWKSTQLEISSALENQALLTLTNNYCEHKKCLSCSFGKTILQTN